MTPQEFFKNDIFATKAGIVLLEVRKGYSKAKLDIKPEHLNAGARTQGGAIFTLCAVSCIEMFLFYFQSGFTISFAYFHEYDACPFGKKIVFKKILWCHD